ncbi:MAG: hypothetical protein A3G93_07085 [Nitrospinae bacterium RIFCSPLOWO2_12_FULL_45_22]|nr:MAG: hypothetical protein A3G93_07085 [Nitrospinae bacterium RIFCSPLOWO2_12_FULL_45_22]
MTNEEIKQKLEASFHPYRCVAEIWDYRQKIRFHIFDQNDKPIITAPEIVIPKINRESWLSSLIRQTKDEIKRKNYFID